MIENQAKIATCSIRCGDGSGTGWLVTSSLVITAHHCIVDSIESKSPIKLKFEIDGSVTELNATLHANDESRDICILRLECDVEIAPIVLSPNLPVEGSKFFAYGYPVAKLSLGHRVQGIISQTLDRLKLKMDLDLQIEPSSTLNDFKGISGAALISENRCIGLLRLAVDKSLGAISIARVADFLRENSVPIEEVEELPSEEKDLVSRVGFAQDFETLVGEVGSGYVFISGAQGIGKSTFCRTYKPQTEGLTYFANYSFTSDDGQTNAMHLAQPEVFYDWLNSQVSFHLTGKAARVSSKSYREIIEETIALLEVLGKHFQSNRQTAVIFIDGLDEVASLSDEILKQFVGVLPARLPEGLVFALVAPSYEKLEHALSSRVTTSSCIIMPELEYSAVRSYCYSQLRADYCSTEIVGAICERAQGHPLYLRYLLDLANNGIGYDELVALPLINGSIRNYYDVLWSQIKIDALVIELLAIIARLRWGIQLPDFIEVLTENERAGFSPALQRIRHLLRSNEAAIYHSSFSDYVTERTVLRSKDVHLRLARHCITQQTTRYGLLNVIYHCLRAESELQDDYAITFCNQSWVDKCVTDGVAPDILLSDVRETLAQAAHKGKLVEVTRLLLLYQRLQFRYDTLIAQSADLMASALLSLGKVQDTIFHVVRYGHLIIGVQETLFLAFKLADVKEFHMSLELLDKAEAMLEKIDITQNQSVEKFLYWYELHLQLFSVRYLAGDSAAKHTLWKFYTYSMKLARSGIKDEDASRAVVLEMLSCMQASALFFEKRYTPMSVIRERVPFENVELLRTLLRMLVHYRAQCQIYDVTPDNQLLQSVFTDLQALIEESEADSLDCSIGVIDTAILLGAPVSLVHTVARSMKPLSPLDTLKFLSNDGVSMDESQFTLEMVQIRAESYKDREMPCPASATLTPSTWRDTIESIFRCLAWSDGAARRASGERDFLALENVWTTIELQVFKQLRFTLAQRAVWQDCYALPEEVFPYLYGILTDLVTKIYPERIGFLLDFVDEMFATQCGLYSEGFRKVLAEVLTRVSKVSMNDDVENQAFSLLKRWSSFVLYNVKNRHELVPELLTIIPIFVKLDAAEQAHKMYQEVLANSMGPTWYKEDQLGLLVDSLSAIPNEEAIDKHILPSVAGLLEAASGEMTFQRYIRYDKANLIELLCRRGEYDKAVNYFTRQVCGTNEQMFSDVTEGDIDRVSPLRGTRFPGGALDEQDAIQRIVESAIPNVHWSLCWALMEVYQFGDRRHVHKAAEIYARMVNRTETKDTHTVMAKRLEWICESDLEDGQKSEFLSSLRNSLPEKLPEEFKGLLKNYERKSDITPSDEVFQIEDEQNSYPEHKSAPTESVRDQMMMPGVFGSQSSVRDSEEAVRKAEKLLVRGNRLAAQKEALAALEFLQQGGWSVWGEHSAGATRAREIIYETAGSADAFVTVYAPLIFKEKHVEVWRRASHLIECLAQKTTVEQRAKLVQCTIEHCGLLVGDTTSQNKKFGFLGESQVNDATLSLLNLLLNALEHPNWRLRDKAAEMLLWLLDDQPQFISIVAPKAFSMSSENSPDVICGVLDSLSNSNVAKVWDALLAIEKLEQLLQSCRHIGRLSTIMRIAKRGSLRDLAGASEILECIRRLILESQSGSQILSEVKEECPDWCLVAKSQWHELQSMGLATKSLVENATSIIKRECAPLTTEDTLELEQLLADRFKGDAMHLQGRWMAKVRYALQVALIPVASGDIFSRVDRIFRPCNPNRLDKMRVNGFASPANNWYKSLLNQRGTISPICGNDLYLDFFERVWIEEEHRWRFLRLTAFLYEEDKPVNVPEKLTKFRATDTPMSNSASWPETCVRGEALPTFLGSFTPALPSEVCMQLSHTVLSDFKRVCWRAGRESFSGDFKSEGCCLSINVRNFMFPRLVQLAWLLEIDGKPVCTIRNGG